MKSRIAVLALLWSIYGLAQQPQSSGAPDFEVSASYVQGAGNGGYRPTCTSTTGDCPGSDLVLHIGKGTSPCSGTAIEYAGGTLTTTNTATNYVYLDPNASCAPAKNTTGFLAGQIMLYKVTAAGGVINAIDDLRSPFSVTNLQVTGNTSVLCSASGTFTSGHLVSIDANKNCIDSGLTATSTGTVSSVATTSPITGGTITTTGTIGCATCAIGPGSSTTNHLAKFSGTDGITLADGGAIPTGTVTSIATTGPITGGTITSTGTIACATCAVQSSIQQEGYTYAADSGTTNAYAVTLSPAPTIVTGSIVVFKAANANTGASTLNVNGGGAVAIKKSVSTALATMDILANQLVSVIYDGTNFQLLAGAGTGSGTRTKTIPHSFDWCTPGMSNNAGNAGANTNAYTNADLGVWEFTKNTAADIWCYIRVPSNVDAAPAALVVLDFGANDNTSGHTDVFNISDVITSSLNLNVGTLTDSSTCTFTTTTTAYAKTECTFTPNATIAADEILVVKIHQAASNSVTADVLMPSPKIKFLEDF